MNIDERLNAQVMAGARAVGLLSALLGLGTMPPAHRDSAAAIVAEFNGEEIAEEA